MVLIWSLAAMLGAYALSLLFYPALGWSSGRRVLTGVILAAALAPIPLAVPARAPVPRLVVAIYVGVLILKMWDLHVGAARGRRPDTREFLAFMANAFWLVHRRKGLERQPTPRRNALELAGALLVCVGAAWLLLVLLRTVDWSGVPFLVEHVAKAVTFFVLATALFDATAALIRSLGAYAVSPVDGPFRSRTPAEFWRRYNRVVGEFLREDVFRRAGGRRHPVRATLVAFAVSGVLHEYLFSVAAGGLQGYQMVFFLLQGVGAALTLRARPGPVVGVAGTFAFNLASSVFFFASFEAMWPGFYAGGLPGWLWGG